MLFDYGADNLRSEIKPAFKNMNILVDKTYWTSIFCRSLWLVLFVVGWYFAIKDMTSNWSFWILINLWKLYKLTSDVLLNLFFQVLPFLTTKIYLFFIIKCFCHVYGIFDKLTDIIRSILWLRKIVLFFGREILSPGRKHLLRCGRKPIWRKLIDR